MLIFTLAVVPLARAASTSTAASTAAYVYIQIQGPGGAVYGFRASSAGQLSAISGGPWKPVGQVVGATSTKFFTAGENLIHSYGILSDGSIGPQLGQIPVLDYAGSGCAGSGGIDQARLDHTGKYLYVLLANGGDRPCAAYQTYIVNKDGSFTFDGDTEETLESGGGADIPSILGNETFAYADSSTGPLPGSGPVPTVIGFRRESSGTLEKMQFTESDPEPSQGSYTIKQPDASPTGNYVVLQLYPGNANPPQLGSYTVDSKGNISSTNTSSNLAATTLDNPSTTFSPSGDLFVAYADNGFSAFVGEGNGMQIYNFNGAAPLTFYARPLGETPIDQVAWDSSSHLYAISIPYNELHVFTVTSTSVTEDASWSIGSPFKMVVVSE
jgi:hypothetical protein